MTASYVTYVIPAGRPRQYPAGIPNRRLRPAPARPDMSCLTCGRTVTSPTTHGQGEEWRDRAHPVRAYGDEPARNFTGEAKS